MTLPLWKLHKIIAPEYEEVASKFGGQKTIDKMSSLCQLLLCVSLDGQVSTGCNVGISGSSMNIETFLFQPVTAI
jgi:hypothetical protein